MCKQPSPPFQCFKSRQQRNQKFVESWNNSLDFNFSRWFHFYFLFTNKKKCYWCCIELLFSSFGRFWDSMVIYYTGHNTAMYHSLLIFERFVKLKFAKKRPRLGKKVWNRCIEEARRHFKINLVFYDLVGKTKPRIMSVTLNTDIGTIKVNYIYKFHSTQINDVLILSSFSVLHWRLSYFAKSVLGHVKTSLPWQLVITTTIACSTETLKGEL